MIDFVVLFSFISNYTNEPKLAKWWILLPVLLYLIDTLLLPIDGTVIIKATLSWAFENMSQNHLLQC